MTSFKKKTTKRCIKKYMVTHKTLVPIRYRENYYLAIVGRMF